MAKHDVHRGPSKEGKKVLTVHLTPEEWEAFRELADEECRSASSQLRFLVTKALAARRFHPGGQL